MYCPNHRIGKTGLVFHSHHSRFSPNFISRAGYGYVGRDTPAPTARPGPLPLQELRPQVLRAEELEEAREARVRSQADLPLRLLLVQVLLQVPHTDTC